MVTSSTPKRTLMYLTYGDRIHRLGAIYSLLSAFRFLPPDSPGYRYFVYTDHPADFASLGVEIHVISDNELQEWLGRSTYKHRRKTMSIIDALERFPGPLAFIDTDTFFKRSPALIFDRIAPGMTCFHAREARLFEAGDDEQNVRLIEGLARKPVIDAAGNVIPFSERSEMWNTGVLGVTPDNIPALRAALPIMDQLWANSGAAPVEQFAVGYTLAGTRRRESLDVVFHYWSGLIRVDFERKLPDIIAELMALPSEERAAATVRYHPQWPLLIHLRSRLREITRRLGIPTRGVVKSV